MPSTATLIEVRQGNITLRNVDHLPIWSVATLRDRLIPTYQFLLENDETLTLYELADRIRGTMYHMIAHEDASLLKNLHKVLPGESRVA